MRFLVVQDYRENRAKCTLTPLEGREDVEFLRLDHPRSAPGPVELGSGILLDMDGEPLVSADAAFLQTAPLIVIDSTWARVPKVLRRVRPAVGAEIRRRALPAQLVTAYPRTSKLYKDPQRGLASIEALFAATAVLGRPLPGLLHGYRWAEGFLSRNADVLRPLGPENAVPLSRLDVGASMR